MKPLGNDLLGNSNLTPTVTPITPNGSYSPLVTPMSVTTEPSMVPYLPSYTPAYPYQPVPVHEIPYEEAGVFPMERTRPAPRLPQRVTRQIIPAPPGMTYLKVPEQNIVPAVNTPYPTQRRYSDRTLLNILTTKNTYFALKRRGMASNTMRRESIDAAVRDEVMREVTERTVSDLAAIQKGEYAKVLAGQEWQYDAIKNNLVDASELRSVMSRLVGVQASLEKSTEWRRSKIRGR